MTRTAAPAAPPPLVVRSRVMPWGFLVALTMAIAFTWLGLRALETNMLPRQLGVFVEPPPGLIGIAFLVFGLFLALIGVSELVRYLSPAVEVVVDRHGIATYGLLGARRADWTDIRWSVISDEVIAFKLRQRGRMPPPDMRVHFSRLDLPPEALLAAIREYRPDLATGRAPAHAT
jgi:hypothetical protein